MSTSKFDRRSFRVQFETGYKINNISLVKSYIIPKKVEVDNGKIKGKKEIYDFKLSINGVIIEHSYEDEKFYYFDFKNIRDMLRDIIPTNEEENEMSNLETMIAYNSLCAHNAYKNILNDKECKNIFNNTIFTNQDIEIKLVTKCRNKFIELEEEYYVSDIHTASN